MAFKIYTKTGDKGETSLYGGKRVAKNDLRIEAYGTTDELNSYIGLVRDQLEQAELRAELKTIQDELFTIGSLLAAVPGKEKLQLPKLPDNAVEKLEQAIDRMDTQLPPLKNFILPGGHTTISYCHIARCVCRRAERLVVGLAQTEEGIPSATLLQYLNRLSDYLFALGRYIAVLLDVEEVTWQAPKS